MHDDAAELNCSPPPPPHVFVTFPFFSGYEDRSESILSRWRASRVKTEYKEIRKIGKQNRHVKYITFIYLFKGISCILDWSRAFVQTCNFKQDVLKIDKQMTSFRKFNKCCSFWGFRFVPVCLTLYVSWWECLNRRCITRSIAMVMDFIYKIFVCAIPLLGLVIDGLFLCVI